MNQEEMKTKIQTLEFELLKYKMALDNAGIDLFDVNFNTGQAYQSDNIAQKMGYKKEDVDTFEKRNNTIYPSDLHDSLIEVEKLRKGQIRKTDLTFRVYGKNSGHFWMKHDGLILHDPSNQEAHFIGTLRDITNEKLYLEELTHLANYDSLTNTYNRRAGLGKLECDLNRVENLSVVYMDIDNFKEINDNMGHIIGDKLLKIFAETIMEAMPDLSYLIRLGGDEFLLVCIMQPYEKIKQICDQFEHQRIKIDESTDLNFSYGLVEYKADEHKTLDGLIHEADQLMYEYKMSKKAD